MTKEEANNIVIEELTVKRNWTMNGLDIELLDDFANILREQVKNNVVLDGVMPVLDTCNRVEVIDNDGRSYVNWKDTNKVEISMQDNNRTMKVFISKKA